MLGLTPVWSPARPGEMDHACSDRPCAVDHLGENAVNAAPSFLDSKVASSEVEDDFDAGVLTLHAGSPGMR